jgi:pyruvate dehydrogenase E2 component (dihydrolipoamide acetyltransferase)
VVPVLRDADKKGVMQIAAEMGELAEGARRQAQARADAGRLLHHQFAGRHRRHRVHPDHQCAGSRDPGRVQVGDQAGLGRQGLPAAPDLPLSLSYDHRVIDGAAAARFTAYLAQLLADMRRAML